MFETNDIAGPDSLRCLDTEALYCFVVDFLAKNTKGRKVLLSFLGKLDQIMTERKYRARD